MNRVEMVDTGEWESWCSDHPLPNGDTGVAFDRWQDALNHAINHHATLHAATAERGEG